ncbi:hypothetical protein FHX74_001071 [Friedmanniella endophytica]|uniref:Uncharacterized protein n=1 Tax=Microlunatus kandeliicorticis TaxID=1759536 RepID=A0A7W3IQM8_9ACTN|nr:hypothetical protein [Microlunatus kandeliicorticis]MBA8793466.1 hypothetical protein [Microlunatus kandeliicorticis]
MGVDPYQVLLAAIAIAIMIGVPLLCHLGFEAFCGRYEERFRRWRLEVAVNGPGYRVRDLLVHRHEVRALRRQRGVPIERLAADLRRLRRLLGQEVERSAVQQFGARMAYDQVLIQACGMLGVEQRLAEAPDGIDREVERIRVEGELENVGLVLEDRRFGQAA